MLNKNMFMRSHNFKMHASQGRTYFNCATQNNTLCHEMKISMIIPVFPGNRTIATTLDTRYSKCIFSTNFTKNLDGSL